jgi:hypothetical protein
MKKLYLTFLTSILFIAGCVPADYYQSSAEKKTLRNEDYIYDKNIRTVLFYPSQDKLSPPIVPLMHSNSLVLHFDELVTDFKEYSVKILNCTHDWKISELAPMQYLDEYNEFLITDRIVSFNTRISFNHYTFVLPRIKISGNYLLVVYKNNNPDDIVISRRFVVFEELVNLITEIKPSNVVEFRDTKQQIDFILNYSGIEVLNPANDIKVVVRQNHRWDYLIKNFRPMYVREFEKRLDYTFFNNEIAFWGGNEFRAFDIRSTQYSGMNIDKIDRKATPIEISLLKDRSRRNEAYSFFADADGKFFTEHFETKGSFIEPDYVYVNFSLESPHADGKVYILGAMNDWRLEREFEMAYDEEQKKYHARPLIKQGFYSYKYVLVTPSGEVNEHYFEGTHAFTQNQYDILVYFSPFGFRSDKVIGYKSLNFQR